jgi:undecaprenyl-diphosphatase
MTLLHAVLLGILQGLTEFIPVSSTAHLLIGQQLLGLPASRAMFSFLVLVQLGTLISLFAFFWKDLLSIARALLDFRRATPERNLGFFIVLATIPALLAGFFLREAVEDLFRTPLLQAAVRLFTAAALLALAERFGRRSRQLGSMTPVDALVIGCFQVLAVFPGASRSGVTISGGMLRGFDRPAAARFAFLMFAPVMLAAGSYEMLEVVRMPDLGEFLPALAAGFVSAAVVGWLAIRWLLAYLARGSLYLFAGYCAAAGSLCTLLLLTGWV